MLDEFGLAALRGELTSIHRIADMGLAALAHAEHLQEQLDGVDESLTSDSLRAHAAEQFVEKMAVLAEQHNAERDAEIAELEKRIASHVCAGPTTINLTENAAVQEYTAELRRELAEERNHVRQHKATIDGHAATIEKLRRELFECESTARVQDEVVIALQDRIRQAQQDAGKNLAPWTKERRQAVIQAVRDVRNALYAWLDLASESPEKAVSIPSGRIRDLIQSLTFRPLTDDGLDLLSTLSELRQENEVLRAAAARRDEESGGLAPDFTVTRDSVIERLGRVKELLHTGPYDQVGREIEEALKELAGVSF
jgi:hypothetical protein